MNRGLLGLFAGLILLLGLPLAAQETNRSMSYGETVSAYFEAEAIHTWTFLGTVGDIISIRGRRIAGRFEPSLSLVAPDATEITDLTYLSLTQDGLYTIKVNEANDQNASLLILNEYSLSLNLVGKHRPASEAGLDPLPTLDALPSLFAGTASLDATLNINIYGSATLSQPDPIGARNDYLLSANRNINLNNANPLARGLSAIDFANTGIALQSTSGAVFFTDQAISALESNSGLTNISLADGTTFLTDFYRINNIQAQDGLVLVTFVDGQKLLAQGQSFEFLRRGGINGEGPNAEPVNLIRLNGAELQSDLAAWQTLALLGADVRVYYPELRFLGESSALSLFFSENIEITDGAISMNIDPLGMGDILLRGDRLTIQPLDGREISQERGAVSNLSIQNRLITLNLTDGSSQLSLPDGTIIASPNAIPADNAALPNQPNFRPRNFNNLGARPFDYHPLPDFDFALLPVNRVNGNFFYQATDFAVANDGLGLEWTRSYNSLAATSPSPMGNGWRHSYQYELDLSYAPLGEIWLTLPDGSRHIFSRNEALFRSDSLLSWTIQQRADATWEAFTTEGYSYDFDLAGTLQSIHFGAHALLFSPLPREYQGSYQSGFFVTDTYGRRIEVYEDETGLIREVRDVLGRSIFYSYAGQELISVDYSHNADTVSYHYLDGRLNRIHEGRALGIDYEVQGRVSRYTINPDGDLQAVRTYSYAPNLTNEIVYVNGAEQPHTFEYDAAFRLIRHDAPLFAYRWVYSNQTGRLSEYSQPDRSVLRYQYDDFGYLTSFTDPIFGAGSGTYSFHYTSPDNRQRLLTALDIPAIPDYITLEYDSNFRLSAVNRSLSVSPRQTSRTSYSYDGLGRIQTLQSPARNLVYSYDEFGYPSSINAADGARIINLRHDILGRLLSETDGRGTVTNYLWSSTHNRLDSKTIGTWQYSYTYDSLGNLTSQNFNGRTTSYSYDALTQLSEYVDSLGRSTVFTYDEAGNLLSRTTPDGSSETFTYNLANLLSSTTDSNGLVTNYAIDINLEGNRTSYSVNYPNGEARRYVYDPLGRIRQVVSFDRTGTESFDYNLSYNALGYLTSIEETHVPAGRRLDITYDLQGNPLTASLNNAATTTYIYNAAGQIASMSDPAGRVTSYEYDSLGNIIRQIQPDGTSISYTYDENGNRSSFTEAGGAEWFYTYDEHNRLTTIIDPANGLSSYEYDDFNNLTAIVNANGSRISLAYDAASHLTEYTDLAGNLSRYQYNERDNLSQIEQAGGLSSDFFYDSADNLTALTQSGGRESLFGRDNEGRIVGITDSLGHSSFFAYNTIGTIGRITNPLGNETTFRWSASGRIVGYSTANGAAYSYGGDSIGRLTSINDSATEQNIALNTLLEYDAAGYISAIRFGTTGTINGNQATVHRYTYTPNGQIASYLPPESDIPYTFEYDVNGRMNRSTDPAGNVTSYAYDVLGNLTELVRAVDTDFETVETYSYDAMGNITRYTAPDGLVSEYTYDSANHLTERLDNGERRYQYEYDAYGRLSQSINPNNQITNYRYDLYGNLIVLERGELSTRYEYDEVNNLRRIQSPAGQSILMTYNALGQRVRYTDAENNAWSYSYDDAGNLSQITDPLGNNTAYRYDFNNRLLSILYPNDALVELNYANNGSLAELRLPNNQRIRTSFDRLGNLSRVEYATNQVVTYERDNLGRLSLQTNADGQSIAYTYDALGRLSSTVSPEISTNRSYDAAGRLTAISAGTNTINYAYDTFGALSSYATSEINASYTFDAAGNLLSRNAGEYGQMTYEYDELYRPKRITMGAEWLEIEYNENGWRTRLLRSNGVETRYVYDDNGRIRNILHLNAAGERLDGFAYEYDAVGNILRVTRIDNWAVLYSYDESQKLISERWLSADNQVRYSVSYGYDAAGNRSEQTTRIGQANPIRTLFVYNNQNQLIEEIRNAEFTIEDRLALPVVGFLLLLPAAWFVRRRPRYFPIALALIPFGFPLFQGIEPPSINYSYDANGNLSSIGFETGNQLNYSYDSFQRLTAIEGINSSGETIATSLSYNALGQLQQVIEAEERYRFVYDAFGLVAIENGGKRTLYYAPLGDTLLEASENQLLWPLTDALGIARSDASNTGSLFAEFAFNSTSFGELINPYQTETSNSRLVINGAYYLAQSQIYLRDSRAYDPRLGFDLQRPPLPDYALSSFNPLSGGLAGLNPTVPNIDPSRLVANPALPPLPTLPDVHSAQAAETARLLAVAQTAYSSINQPNILADFALHPNQAQLVGIVDLPSLEALLEIHARESFAASLHEVPLYAPLVHELPMLLNFAQNQP